VFDVHTHLPIYLCKHAQRGWITYICMCVSSAEWSTKSWHKDD